MLYVQAEERYHIPSDVTSVDVAATSTASSPNVSPTTFAILRYVQVSNILGQTISRIFCQRKGCHMRVRQVGWPLINCASALAHNALNDLPVAESIEIYTS